MTEQKINTQLANQIHHYVIEDQFVPKYFYGTAWKEERTEDLTFQALQAGFRAIDTANQRKHYYEEGVGRGIKKFLELSTTEKFAPSPDLFTVTRKDLFLQSKFTYSAGQDLRKPYNENDSFSQQVADSFASSLNHLNTNYLDSYVLHGPFMNHGIAEADLEVWGAMENLIAKKQVHFLGVSNVSPQQLSEFCKKVHIKPRFVQNRCFARLGWDKQVREICRRENIIYQGFSLLTANSIELASHLVTSLAQKYNKTIPQIIFRFSQQLGMICLTGSTNPMHLSQDLNIYDFELTPTEVMQIENIAF